MTRLLPPPDGQAYFGFTYRLWDTSDLLQGDSRPFAQRIQDSIENELAGKPPTFLTVWSDFGHRAPFSALSSDISEVRSITGAHSLLYLDWTLSATTAVNGFTTKDIASGALDTYIRRYGEDLKAFADPVLLRLFGGEFNGSWWYGQSPLANPNLSAADFVAAWRRVVRIFRGVGADNVSFAWTPNVYPHNPAPGWIDSNIAAYYPGDSYVDWAGADTYDYAPLNWLDSVYDFAVAHTKPFFLAEWGIRHASSTLTAAQEQDWLRSMFDYFDSHPDVKAINYFNYNTRTTWNPSQAVYLDGGQVNYMPNINDYDSRLLAQSGADFQGTYASRIANPRYTSTILTQRITPPIRCLVPNVKKRPLATARRMILASHCTVGTVHRAYSKHIKKRRVIAQKPKPSTLLPNYGRLSLLVSRGRKP